MHVILNMRFLRTPRTLIHHGLLCGFRMFLGVESKGVRRCRQASEGEAQRTWGHPRGPGCLSRFLKLSICRTSQALCRKGRGHNGDQNRRGVRPSRRVPRLDAQTYGCTAMGRRVGAMNPTRGAHCGGAARSPLPPPLWGHPGLLQQLRTASPPRSRSLGRASRPGLSPREGGAGVSSGCVKKAMV